MAQCLAKVAQAVTEWHAVGRRTQRLSAKAAELLDEVGYLNAMADLFERLASGELTRDQTSSCIGARRCLESFYQARQDRETKARHEELVAELKAAREAMRAQAGGSTSFEGDPLAKPDGLQATNGKGQTPTRN